MEVSAAFIVSTKPLQISKSKSAAFWVYDSALVAAETVGLLPVNGVDDKADLLKKYLDTRPKNYYGSLIKEKVKGETMEVIHKIYDEPKIADPKKKTQ